HRSPSVKFPRRVTRWGEGVVDSGLPPCCEALWFGGTGGLVAFHVKPSPSGGDVGEWAMRPDDIIAAIDAGLQSSSEGGAILPDQGICWRCCKTPACPLTPVGLCRDCDDWLHADLTQPTPADATLLAPGT